MKTRSIVVTATAASVFVLALFQQHTTALMNPARTTYLTFSQPVRLPDMSLGAGTYIFEIANPGTSANVVRVLSRDRRTPYFQGLVHREPKPEGMSPDQQVSLSEAPAGAAPAINVWWHEKTGYRFTYR